MEKQSFIPKMTSASIFYALASLSLVIIGLIYFSSLITPFVIAVLISFIINELTVKLGKIRIKGKKLPSYLRSILAFILIFAVIYGVVELLIMNIEGIVASMPEYVANLHDSYAKATSFLSNPKYTEYIQKWLHGIDLAGMATSTVNSLSGILANSAVVLVYVIFLLMGTTSAKMKLDKLFPVKGTQYKKFTNNMHFIGGSVRYYISSMTMISLVTGIVSYVILLIIGVEYAFLWAFLIFILNFIPYIGPLISSLLPAIFAVITTGHLIQFVIVFAAMEGVQIIIGNFIQPMVMGKGTNLSAVVVIVSLAFWGMIWGITGMILAVPIMAVVVIICSQVEGAEWVAILLSEKGDIETIEEDKEETNK
jgi:predicted PurR-regulated permease PerM